MKTETYIYVRELGTDKEVHRVRWTGGSERNLEKCVMGMLRNMDTERFYVDDAEATAALARATNS